MIAPQKLFNTEEITMIGREVASDHQEVDCAQLSP